MRAHRLKGCWALGLLAAWLPAQAQTVRYVHTDALGSPVAMTDANRVVVQTRQYEPYGKRLNGSNNDRPGYTGHVEDAATGLTYMQQRYYDPGIGRFLSVDPVAARPLGDNFNRYAYAFNNPYKFTDPDGRENALGIVARFPDDLSSASATDLNVQSAAQRSVDLTVNAVMAGGTPEQVNNAGKWSVTVDPRIDGAPKTGGIAETRTGTSPDGSVAVVETTYSNRILGVAEANGTVTLTGMTAEGGDAALLAVGAHDLAHSTAENRALPAGQAKESNASSQAVRLGAQSPDVNAGAIKKCDECFSK